MQRLKGEERWKIDYEGKGGSRRRGICRFYWENLKTELSSSVFVILQLQISFNVGLHNNFSLQHTLELALDLLIHYFFSFLTLYLLSKSSKGLYNEE